MEKLLRRDRLSRKIFIQQDQANNHIGEDDKVFKEALMEKGINSKLYTQAANSPDINLLDLGHPEFQQHSAKKQRRIDTSGQSSI